MLAGNGLSAIYDSTKETRWTHLRFTIQSSGIKTLSRVPVVYGKSAGGGLIVSESGRYFAVGSNIARMTKGDTNGRWDLYLYDTQTKRRTRLNLMPENSAGQAACEKFCRRGFKAEAIKFIGDSKLLFMRTGYQLPENAEGLNDISIYDWVYAELDLTSLTVTPIANRTREEFLYTFSSGPHAQILSDDARFLLMDKEFYGGSAVSGKKAAFYDRSGALCFEVDEDGNGPFPRGFPDGAFARFDRDTCELKTADLFGQGRDFDGVEGIGRLYVMGFSGNGRYAAFLHHEAPADLPPETVPTGYNLYVYDFDTGITTLENFNIPITPNNPSNEVNDESYFGIRINDDGNLIYINTQRQAIPDDTNNTYDIYRYDRTTRTSERLLEGSDVSFSRPYGITRMEIDKTGSKVVFTVEKAHAVGKGSGKEGLYVAVYD